MPRPIKLTLISLVFCYNTIGLVADRNVSVNLINKAIEGNELQISADKTLKWCADRCMYLSDCKSLGFNFNTNKCLLYSINSTEADRDGVLKDKIDNIIMDVHQWIQGRTGGCWDKPCPSDTVCIPHNSTPRCDPYGCPRYITPKNGASNQGNRSVIGIGDKIEVGCEPEYLTKYGTNIRWTLTCSAHRNFGTWIYRCYTREELCRHYILQTLLDRMEVYMKIDGSVLRNSTAALSFGFSSTSPSLLNPKNMRRVFTVVFDSKKWIGGIASKGESNGRRVESYKVAYSSESSCSKFISVRESNGSEKIFPGNNDDDRVVTNYLGPFFLKCIELDVKPATNTSFVFQLEFLECRD